MTNLEKALMALCSVALIALIGTAYLYTSLVLGDPRYEPSDLNHDGVVDAHDLSILTSHWTPKVYVDQAAKSGGVK